MTAKIDRHSCDLTEMLLRMERVEREAEKLAKLAARTRSVCNELLLERKLNRRRATTGRRSLLLTRKFNPC